MTPQERLTRRELFGAGLEKLGITAIGVAVLAACTPAAPPAGNKDQGRIEGGTDGWQHYSSTKYPYEMDYPSSWIAQSGAIETFLGPDVSGFRTNLNIIVEPVSSTLEDYSQKIIDQTTQVIMRTRRVGQFVSGYDTRIANQKATVIRANMPPIFAGGPDYNIISGIFVANGRGWQITLSSHPSVSQAEEQKFNRIIASFKLK